MPLNQFKAINLELFLDNYPLNFLLFYGDYEVINTVYLDDGSPLVDLSLELFNQSPTQTVKFEKPNNLSASADNCHFSLALEGIFVLESPPEGWDIAVEETKSYTGSNFYFLKKQGGDLQPKAANGSTNKIVLTLKKFRAAPEGGTRTLRAELTYGPLLKDKNNQSFEKYGQYSSYGNTIFITNNRGGKKTLPLQVDFAAGNSVLNDGTANSLELLIANKSWPNNNLSLSTDSEFLISFETDKKEGAVATTEQVKASNISSNSSKWIVPTLTGTTEWTVQPQGISQLASGEAIKLTITNLVTNHSSGAGYLYVRYKNIPNYPDGQFVVPLEKTPLLYRENKVGIGTNAPKIHLAIGDNDTGLHQQGDGQLAIYTDYIERVRIDKIGNFGIGTNSPNEKLEVSGNIKATGAIRPSAGNTENQGIMFPKDPGGGGSDAAWIRYYARSGEACTLEIGISNDTDDHIALMPSGNVGIGTTTPSATLHVNGRIKDKTGLVMPVGSILPYAGGAAPEGWLLCDGTSRDNNEYKDLFDVIEYKYGGSGNNFSLPNLKGRVPTGLSSTESEFNQLNKTGGSKTHTLAVNEMPSHNHGVNDPGHNHIYQLHNGHGKGYSDDAGEGFRNNQSTQWSSTNISIQNTGDGQPHNNLQPYLTVNYIIKY